MDALLEQGRFDGGQPFRRTQKQALEAYQRYLHNEQLPAQDRLKGFFEIPTGIGKTALFIAIVAAAHKAAQADGQELKSVIVVPTLPLLAQTRQAFHGNGGNGVTGNYFPGFAPWLKGQTGLYGGRQRELGQPVTIMTYDAWANRLEDESLNPDDIDILINDEAHRGTSEKRIELTAQFNDATTLKLAFTATAHFDEEKSVQQSHEREIYYKSAAEAIREGELAAYISSQRYVIRVDPDDCMLSDEFADASDEEKTAYRRAARQNAWNRRMVTLFREGTDQKTGDPLSDNQAGFFVEGIRQADKLEVLLNDDEALSAKAKSMGYKGVAVAIHSALPQGEQDRRMRAYQNGEYLAVVGDEKFKEGYDHPPMKTIFDCPHESRVDKAQIIGRGLRQWWNDLKGRSEGLTIIDTVVFFADEDPDKEQRNKERALMNTVSVKQIMEDVDITGPEAPRRRALSSGSSGGSVFAFDPDVEEYTTAEDIYELEQQIRAIEEREWSKNPLTLIDILETIEAYCNSNNNNTPNVSSGQIEEGPLAGRIMIWPTLNAAIANGSNGLSDDPDYQQYADALAADQRTSLFSLLAYFGFTERKRKLTMADIEITIKAYRDTNKNQNPSQVTGDIQDGPLAGRMSWNTLNAAIQNNGRNALFEDTEYQTYRKSLHSDQKPGLSSLLVYFGFAEKKQKLTMADVRATIDAYRGTNKNQNPFQGSGEIQDGPLAGRMTWVGLNQSIKNGSNNLFEDPEYQAYRKSLHSDQKPGLSSLLVYFGFAEKKQKLTMADIRATIKVYRQSNNGKNPVHNSGDVEQGPLAGQMLWGGLNQSITNGSNGLSDDPEYQKYRQSLAASEVAALPSLLIYLGFAEKKEKPTMANIKATIEAYRKANNNKNPSVKSGDVEQGPLAGCGKWNGLSDAITVGRNGLSDDPEYHTYRESLHSDQKPGLSSLLVYFEFANKKNKLTMADIKATIEAYRKANNDRNPTQNSGDVEQRPLAGWGKWGGLNSAVIDGSNKLSEDPVYQEWLKTESKPSLSKLCKKMDDDKRREFALERARQPRPGSGSGM